MSIMAKTPSGYKKIGSAYLGERPVDKVFNANGDVVYALQRELTGVPPLLFKGKEQSELLNYRIYGDTIDGESVGDRTGNLFDVSTITLGCYINDEGQIIRNDGINTSDFIKVSPNTNYTYKGAVIYDANIIRITYYDQSKNFISRYFTPGNAANGETVTTPSNCEYVKLSYDNAITNLMFNLGSTPLPYEPYGYKVPVTVEGKNLLPNTATSRTVNGVTFTVNSDGSVTCNGTATALITFTVNAVLTLPVGEFILTGSPTGGSLNSSYYLYVQTDNISPQNFYTDTGNGATINNTSADIAYSTRIVIERNYSINNRTFYPMIRKADIEDNTYEPYHAPVTTPIYLPEQIKMVGDEAEYIDYAEQKQHRVRENLFNSSNLTQNVNLSSTDGLIIKYTGRIGINIPIIINGNVTLSYRTENNTNIRFMYTLFRNNEFIGRTVNKSSGDTIYGEYGDKIYIVFYIDGASINMDSISNIMLNPGTEVFPYKPYIEETELDVTLPALPTLSGTNTMSIDTTVQPSRMDIKGRIKTLT